MAGSIENGEPLPLHAEFATVGKRRIARTVRVDRVTRTRYEDITVTLARETVTAERIGCATFVTSVPDMREEDGVIVIPVVEEVLVTERRLMLVEEIRIRRVRTERAHTERVSLRAQDIVVTRSNDIRNIEGNTSMSSNVSSPPETIVALFDTASHAALAVQDLRAAGIPAASVEQHEAVASDRASFRGPASATPRAGFWSRLFGAAPDLDTDAYDRSLDLGATVVSVRPPAERLEDVIMILEGHHPVDMDERAAEFATSRDPVGDAAATVASDGLADGRRIDAALPLEAPSGSSSSDPARASESDRPSAWGHASDATRDPASARGSDEGDARGETIALSAEALTVGKRVINRGGTRVRRYVVETPVEEQVSLHGEHVSVERRAVDDVRASGAGSFTERTIEMTETDEVPVVTRNARVVEEVVLRKEARDRTETVRDTIRREDVAIERLEGDGAGTR